VLQYNAALTLQQANPNARVLTFVFYHCRGVGGIREQRHCLEFHGHSPLTAEHWSVGLGDLDAEQYGESEIAGLPPRGGATRALAAWMRQQPPGHLELRLRLLTKIRLGKCDQRTGIADWIHAWTARMASVSARSSPSSSSPG
jgi:hypothetical protein